MNTKTMNPEFARIGNLAIEEYGWYEFYRDPFILTSNGQSRQIITLANRPESLDGNVRLMACTMQVPSVEIITILYRIGLRMGLEQSIDECVCLFHTPDKENPYKIGFSRTQEYQDFKDTLLIF